MNRLQTLLLVSLFALIGVLNGCSSSSSMDSTSGDPSDNVGDSNASEDSDNSEGEVNGNESSNVTAQNSSGTDPQSPTTARLLFDIQIPAYVSDALQVHLQWNTTLVVADWVGDEYWSAAGDFSTDTQQRLTVTFYDDNGDITLASYETMLAIGSNESQMLQVSSDLFDVNKWDDDGDGESNLSELIAGTYTSAPVRILLFSETQDFRHDSTDIALDTLEELAASSGIITERAADSDGVFNQSTLAAYAAVVWVMTSGDVLDQDEQSVFEEYIRAGGGFAGIHAASFTEYEWPWYGSLVGAYFESHPVVQTATQFVENASHPSTLHLLPQWTRTDEWYDYQSNPREKVNVLLSLDESSYSGGTMGEDHPSAWYHEYDGGRSWYTGGGHTIESYTEPDFQLHLLGGIRYAAGIAEPGVMP